MVGAVSRLALLTGCPRSGTSILGELVATLEGVDYRFEPGHPWWPWGHGIGAGGAGSDRLTERDVVHARQARAWLAGQAGPLVVEKSPRMVIATRLHRTVFPESKIVVIVRHPLDVACSLVPGLSAEPGARGQIDWHHIRVPSWPRLLDDYKPGPLRGAHVWAEASRLLREDLGGRVARYDAGRLAPGAVDHYAVRYEDLLRDPVMTLQGIAGYLEAPLTRESISACRSVVDRPGLSEAAGQDRWHRPHARHVGRWKDEIPEDQAEACWAAVAEEAGRWGYGRATLGA